MAISKIGSKALVDCSVAAVDIEDNSITSAKLAGSIANAKLANSSITVNGTSINLGASGSIPAVSWQSVITADGSTGTTAVAGNGYFIDTTSAAHTLTLPSSPSIGDTVAIKDYAGTFGTNNLTIARNSSNIQGVANDSLISTNRASLTLVYVDATKGWLYAVESNVADLESNFYVTATGGTITESGDYKIHTFTGDGCFVVSCAGTGQPYSAKVDYLVVAGGGGGAASQNGGGGAGGYRESSGTASGCYTASPLGACVAALPVSATTYPVTVGAGGAGGPYPSPDVTGNNGSNSVFSTITSTGGGKGGGDSAGNTGGSGGGGGAGTPSSPSSAGGSGNTPPTSPPQGNNGGTGYLGQGGSRPGGGGGGAGAVGTDGPIPGAAPNSGGPGGSGVASSITGSSVIRAGGGGGSVARGNPTFIPNVASTGGSGGGGAGGVGSCTGVAGTVNTGGGGGAGGGGLDGGACVTSGSAGGSGIVIIRYKFQ
jgi:hypothetical protein